MVKRFEFNGSGGALFGQFFVGMLLTMFTLGIYYPWFIVKLNKYVYENTVFKTDSGDVRFTFNGTGGQLFGTWLGGFLLTIITCGIYYSWFMVNLTKFFQDNSRGRTADGREYRMQFSGTGGSLFVTILVGYLLSMLTLGIYGAWFVCNLAKFFAQNTTIYQGAQQVGTMDFKGNGGELLGTWLIGMFLTIITFGLYGSWFTVKLLAFFNGNTEAVIDNEKYRGGFTGDGGELFMIHLKGYILTLITLGIYGAWYYCNLMKFQFGNTTYNEAN